MTDALDEIEKLVLNTAKQAQAEDTPLQEKIDALKSLAPYAKELLKAKGREPSDDEGSFDSLASQIAAADEEHNGGNPSVHHRARRN